MRTANSRQVTPEDLQRFKNPENLIGARFLLSPETPEQILWQVVSYTRTLNRGVKYDVIFDDCDDPISVEEEEMAGMIENSLYYIQ